MYKTIGTIEDDVNLGLYEFNGNEMSLQLNEKLSLMPRKYNVE